MESVKQASENVSSGGAGPSLIKHVFNFDDDSKNEMMNIIQYSLLAVIPIVFLNKSIQKFVPDVDEECVNELIHPGRNLGVFSPTNNCQSFVHRVLNKCSTYGR